MQTWKCLLLTMIFTSIKLNTWKSSLSPEVDIGIASRPTATPHRLMLHLTYWWLFILLHRPFFHRRAKLIHSTDKEIDHVKVCIPLLCSIKPITDIVLLSSASAPQKTSWSYSRLGIPSTHCDTHQSLSYRPSFQLEQYTSYGASKQPPDPA